jgi:hypothetical protein
MRARGCRSEAPRPSRARSRRRSGPHVPRSVSAVWTVATCTARGHPPAARRGQIDPGTAAKPKPAISTVTTVPRLSDIAAVKTTSRRHHANLDRTTTAVSHLRDAAGSVLSAKRRTDDGLNAHHAVRGGVSVRLTAGERRVRCRTRRVVQRHRRVSVARRAERVRRAERTARRRTQVAAHTGDNSTLGGSTKRLCTTEPND